MNVMVTGATGFIGRHVVTELLANGHSVIAIARDLEKAKAMPWFNEVEFVQCDLHDSYEQLFKRDSLPNAIVHLAWPGLPNYQGFFHISKNLPADLAFLEAAVNAGISHLVVAGTCQEYGFQYGPLEEEMVAKPTTPYGFAKNVLCEALRLLQKEKQFAFQWMRLFYMHGEGQNKNSLLAQLNSAIEEGKESFNMSMGDQLRDYLPVKEVAKNFIACLENPQIAGIINCCSGKPSSVFDIVSQQIIEKGSNIKLNRGYYPYPNYEPLAFWGDPTKLNKLRHLK
jgi:nucleoside-diphosphate-sugar epimerase